MQHAVSTSVNARGISNPCEDQGLRFLRYFFFIKMQDFVSEFLYGIQAYMIKSVLGDHKVEVVDSIVVVKGT